MSTIVLKKLKDSRLGITISTSWLSLFKIKINSEEEKILFWWTNPETCKSMWFFFVVKSILIKNRWIEFIPEGIKKNTYSCIYTILSITLVLLGYWYWYSYSFPSTLLFISYIIIILTFSFKFSIDIIIL